MKAGTTTAFDLLSQHPQICASKVKEPEFFSPYSGTKLNNYYDLWEIDGTQHRYRMEASTGYTKSLSSSVPKNIRRYGINPKLIYILRDPLDRIESHYNFMKRSFGMDWNSRIDDEHLVIASDYARHIDNFLGEFPRENMLICDFRTLSENPLKFCRNCFEFLDVDHPKNITVGTPKNATRYDTSITEAWVRRKLKPFRSLMPHAAIQPMKRAIDLFPKTGRKVSLTNKQKEAIMHQLYPGMIRLEKQYNFDVKQWGFH